MQETPRIRYFDDKENEAGKKKWPEARLDRRTEGISLFTGREVMSGPFMKWWPEYSNDPTAAFSETETGHMKALKEKLDRHAHFLAQDCEGWEDMRADFSGENLARVNLCGIDLSHACLKGANLRYAVLDHVNLSGADLSGADMRGAELKQAILEGADLSGTDLVATCFYGARLVGANLESAKMQNTGMARADVRMARFAGTALDSVELRDSRLEGAFFKGSRLEHVNLERSHMNGSDLSGAKVTGTSFYKADLSDASLEGASIYGSNLECASLHRARLEGAVLHTSNFKRTDFKEAYLADAHLLYSDFTGANLRGVAMPEVRIVNTNMENADMACAGMAGADIHGSSFKGTDLEGADMTETSVYHSSFMDANVSNIVLSSNTEEQHVFDTENVRVFICSSEKPWCLPVSFYSKEEDETKACTAVFNTETGDICLSACRNIFHGKSISDIVHAGPEEEHEDFVVVESPEAYPPFDTKGLLDAVMMVEEAAGPPMCMDRITELREMKKALRHAVNEHMKEMGGLVRNTEKENPGPGR